MIFDCLNRNRTVIIENPPFWFTRKHGPSATWHKIVRIDHHNEEVRILSLHRRPKNRPGYIATIADNNEPSSLRS